MSKSILIREFKRGDEAFLEEIIRRTWQYDRFCSPKTARRMARVYLISCLAGQTFARVAQLGGRPVGVIMGRDRRLRPSRRFTARLLRAELSMACSGEGRRVLKAFSGIDGVDRELLKSAGKDYDGELAFFAVDENCRGTGIGKDLFASLLQYMQRQGIRSFYLYTDSSCNYGFYEHQGMVRCGEKSYRVPIGVENEMRFYLYEYQGGAA